MSRYISRNVENIRKEVIMARLAKDNKIFKIGRGVYGAEEFYNYDEFLNIQNNCKKVIFSYFTSLRIQGYSEFIPAKFRCGQYC